MIVRLLIVMAVVKFAESQNYINQQPVTIPSDVLWQESIEDVHIDEANNFLLASKNKIASWSEKDPNFLQFSIYSTDSMRTWLRDSYSIFAEPSNDTSIPDKIYTIANKVQPKKKIEHEDHFLESYKQILLLDDESYVMQIYRASKGTTAIIKAFNANDTTQQVLFLTQSPPGKMVLLPNNRVAVNVADKLVIINATSMRVSEFYNIANLDVTFLEYVFEGVTTTESQLFIFRLVNQSYYVFKRQKVDDMILLTQFTEKIKKETVRFQNTTHILYVSEDVSVSVLRSIYYPNRFIAKKPFTSNYSANVYVQNAENWLISDSQNLIEFNQAETSFKVKSQRVTEVKIIQKAWKINFYENIVVIFTFGLKSQSSPQNKILSLYIMQIEAVESFSDVIDFYADNDSGFVFTVVKANNNIFSLRIHQYAQFPKARATGYFNSSEPVSIYLKERKMDPEHLDVLVLLEYDNGTVKDQIWRYFEAMQQISKINQRNGPINSDFVEFNCYPVHNYSLYMNYQMDYYRINFMSENSYLKILPIPGNWKTTRTVWNVVVVFFTNCSCSMYEISYPDEDNFEVTFLNNINITELNFTKIDEKSIKIFKDVRPSLDKRPNFIIYFRDAEFQYFYNTVEAVKRTPIRIRLSSTQPTPTNELSAGLFSETGYFETTSWIRVKLSTDKDVSVSRVDLSSMLNHCNKGWVHEFNSPLRITLVCQRDTKSLVFLLLFNLIDFNVFSTLWTGQIQGKFIDMDYNRNSNQLKLLQQGPNNDSTFIFSFLNYGPILVSGTTKTYSSVSNIKALSRDGRYLMIQINSTSYAVVSTQTDQIQREFTMKDTCNIADIDNSGKYIAYSTKEIPEKIIVTYLDAYKNSCRLSYPATEIRLASTGYLIMKSKTELLLGNYNRPQQLLLQLAYDQPLIIYAFNYKIIAYSTDGLRIKLRYFDQQKGSIGVLQSSEVFSKLIVDANGDLYAYVGKRRFMKWSFGNCSKDKLFSQGVCYCPATTKQVGDDCNCEDGFFKYSLICKACDWYCDKCTADGCSEYKTGVVVGVIAGGIVLIGILAMIIKCLLKKRKKQDESVLTEDILPRSSAIYE